MSSLRRSDSVLFLPAPKPQLSYARSAHRSSKRRNTSTTTDAPITIRTPRALPNDAPAPLVRTRKASLRPTQPTPPPRPPTQVILPSKSSPITQHKTTRTTSPLSPQGPLSRPGRPVFPRSKPEPDLYKVAIKAHMRSSPVGQQILHMGPRLALSIFTATQELERMVAAEGQAQGHLQEDVVMADSWLSPATTTTPVLTASWVVVRGNEDWEMVDCSA